MGCSSRWLQWDAVTRWLTVAEWDATWLATGSSSTVVRMGPVARG